MKLFTVGGLCTVAMVVALAGPLGCSGSRGAGGAAGTAAVQSQQAGGSASTGAADKSKVSKVGEEATSGEWKLTVKSIAFMPAAGGATAEQGKDLAVVTLDLKNGGSAGQGTGPAYFKFAGADGVAIEAAPTSDPEFIFNTPQPINAGETRTIKIAYPVPAGDKEFQLTFEPFVEGGATPAVIDIK